MIAGLVATVACGSSKRRTSVAGDTAGSESALGGTRGGGFGGASATAGQGGNTTTGGTGGMGGMGGTLTVGGDGGRSGTGGSGGSAAAQAGMSGTGALGGNVADGGTGDSGTDAGAAGEPATSAGSGGLGGTAGAPAATTLDGCATWTIETAPNATSSITPTDGGLLLFRPGDDPSTRGVYDTSHIAISQPGLTGDFDVVVEFDHFQPGDARSPWGPVFETGVWFHDPDGLVYQASAQVGAGDAQLQVDVHDGDTLIEFFSPTPATLVDAAGSLEIQRSAGIFTASAVINNVKNSKSSSTPYNAEPLLFYIGIGYMGMRVGPADASVRITRVTVKGGGGSVLSDTFDCTQ